MSRLVWTLPNGEPFVGAHYCIWYKDDWSNPGNTENKVPFTPKRGSYQSNNPDIIQQHLEEASRIGVNTFVLSWMPPEEGSKSYEDKNLELLLEKQAEFYEKKGKYVSSIVVTENNRLQERWMKDLTYCLVMKDTQAISLEGERLLRPALSRRKTVEQYIKVSSYLLKEYGENPCWLRVMCPDNVERHVIGFYTPDTLISYDLESLESFQRFLKDKYKSISQLNSSWKIDFTDWSEAKPLVTEKGNCRDDTKEWFMSTVDKAWSTIRKGIQDETGYDVTIIGCGHVHPFSDLTRLGFYLPNLKSLGGYFDYAYVRWDITPDALINTYIASRNIFRRWTRENKQFLGVCAEPGYDDRFLSWRRRRQPEYIPRSKEFFEKYLSSVLTLEPDGFFICSYNEWWEGTAIETSEEFETQYLEIAKKYVDLFKSMYSYTH